MEKKRILVVDDDAKIARLIEFALSKAGFEIDTASSGKMALEKVRETTPDMILLDVVLPDTSGLRLLSQFREIDENMVVLMISAHATIKSAIKAIKDGATDFVTKPFEIDELISHVTGALEARRLKDEIKELRSQLKDRYRFENIIGVSGQMKQVYKSMEKVIDNNVSILVRGESGTGKELVARSIHFNGPRRNGPFVDINCAAIPETLLESELFGYEKGVFTGALARRIGLFEQASEGTIFLDEIGDLTLNMQVKLLRVLQEKAIQRIGGNKKIKIDIRIIAATHRNLEEEVKRNNFREDLYYRLNIFPIFLPPLRERKEDVVLLMLHFLEKYSREFNKKVKKVAPEVVEMLKTYPWPGNIRELENSIERAVVMASGDTLKLEHFPVESKYVGALSAESGKPPSMTTGGAEDQQKMISMDEMEKNIIAQTLKVTNGNITQAAKTLKVSRDTLYRKIKRYQLQ